MKRRFFVLALLTFSTLYVSAQWTLIPTGGTGNYYDLAVMDANHVAIASDNNNYGETVVTANGGTSFTNTLQTFQGFDHAAFAGDSTFYIGGPLSSVYSTDAGATWSPVYRPWGYETAAFFTDPDHGFTSHLVGGAENGGISTTDDACVTWDTVPDTLGGNQNGYKDLWFFDANNGVAVGTNYIWFPTNGMVSRTTNGGASWSRTYFNYTLFPDDIAFPTTSIGFVSGGNHIAKSIDGGFTWAQLPVDSTREYTGIAFPDVNTGFAVGIYYDSVSTSHPFISRTTDGGATWTDQVFPAFTNGAMPRAIKCVDAVNCYCVGDSGLVLKTTDGGTNARPEPSILSGSIKIFPNPATDEVNVSASFAAPFNGTAVMRLTAMDGREMMRQEWVSAGTETEIKFAVNDLAAGMYAITLSGEGFSESTRLIVE
jgi:photosystem II stability/assembly factor-like uncharacterized protein